jgi:eukaryotic-like serine/threonine-protein kinase
MAAPRAPEPGDVLSQRYSLLQEVGRGAMGIVFRARDLQSDEIVAVKVIGVEHRHNPERLARFRREAQAANRIDHPNVIRVLGYDELPGGVPYLVEEFLDGRDLQSRLESGDTFSHRETIYILSALSDALEAAHARGIVHRDLKPGNVVLGKTSAGKLQVKLVDFGLAKILAADPGAWQTMQVATVGIGTPAYMSPEQIRGEPLDGRADVYALGVILYQLLTGSLPFWGEEPSDIAEKVLSSKAEHVKRRARGREIPSALARLAMQAISKRPEDRPGSAAEFKRRLQEARRSLDEDAGFFTLLWRRILAIFGR